MMCFHSAVLQFFFLLVLYWSVFVNEIMQICGNDFLIHIISLRFTYCHTRFSPIYSNNHHDDHYLSTFTLGVIENSTGDNFLYFLKLMLELDVQKGIIVNACADKYLDSQFFFLRSICYIFCHSCIWTVFFFAKRQHLINIQVFIFQYFLTLLSLNC